MPTERRQSETSFLMMKSSRMLQPNSSSKLVQGRVSAVPRLMRMSWSRFAIWVMAAGHITTSLLRSRLASIVPRRSLLAQIMIHPQTSGLWLALSSRWLLATSYSSLAREVTMIRMMITWLK